MALIKPINANMLVYSVFLFFINSIFFIFEIYRTRCRKYNKYPLKLT